MQSLREDGIDVDQYLNVVDSRELKQGKAVTEIFRCICSD